MPKCFTVLANFTKPQITTELNFKVSFRVLGMRLYGVAVRLYTSSLKDNYQDILLCFNFILIFIMKVVIFVLYFMTVTLNEVHNTCVLLLLLLDRLLIIH